MALSKLVLKQGLMSLFDEELFPETYEGAANNFSWVVNNYALTIVPPSTSFESARREFVSAFIENKSKESIEILVDAVRGYCEVLAIGMQIPGCVVVSPTGSVALTAGMEIVAEQSLQGMDGEGWVEMVSSLIDSYFRTGKVIQTETGTITPWS